MRQRTALYVALSSPEKSASLQESIHCALLKISLTSAFSLNLISRGIAAIKKLPMKPFLKLSVMSASALFRHE